MGGLDTLREIRMLDSTVPVFVSSGYSDDPVMTDPSQYGFTASISKPFHMHELSLMLDKYIARN
jgi:DNA-binding NarL/FixJ family response regulator